jgi:biotin carboxylase
LGDETARLVRDKRLMKEAFEKAGLRTPAFRRFSSLEDLEEIGEAVGWPLVVKPSNAGGSEGVRLVESRAEAGTAFDALLRAVGGNGARHGLDERAFQAEEYVEAERELSVEILNTPQGRYPCSVTRKTLTPPPYFAELGHVTAAPGEGDGLYVDKALAACDALGLDRGVAHVEMRLPADGQPSLLEVNARLPGDFITEIVEHATGLNLFELHAACFQRDDVTAHPLPLGQAAVAFVKAEEGQIAAVRSPAPDSLPPGLVALRTFAKPGDHVGQTIDSNTRGQAMIELSGGDVEPQRLAAELAKDMFEMRERTLVRS